MAKAVQKIKLSPSHDIPFNQLVLSQSNVRRIKAGISAAELTAAAGANLRVGLRERWTGVTAAGIGHASYAVTGGVSNVVPVDLHIRGCPPRPVQLLKGLLALLDRVA